VRKIILLGMVLFPFTVFAASDCRVIVSPDHSIVCGDSSDAGKAADCLVLEYPDHYEAVCVGNAQKQKPASSQITQQDQISGQGQTDAPPEIVISDLARLHGAYWLKTRPRQ
jgi:hypothetical protein